MARCVLTIETDAVNELYSLLLAFSASEGKAQPQVVGATQPMVAAKQASQVQLPVVENAEAQKPAESKVKTRSTKKKADTTSEDTALAAPEKAAEDTEALETSEAPKAQPMVAITRQALSDNFYALGKISGRGLLDAIISFFGYSKFVDIPEALFGDVNAYVVAARALPKETLKGQTNEAILKELEAKLKR